MCLRSHTFILHHLPPTVIPLIHCRTTHRLPHAIEYRYFRGHPEVWLPSRPGSAPWGRPNPALLLDQSTFRPTPVCCKTSGPLAVTPPECWSRSTPLPLRAASVRWSCGEQASLRVAASVHVTGALHSVSLSLPTGICLSVFSKDYVENASRSTFWGYALRRAERGVGWLVGSVVRKVVESHSFGGLEVRVPRQGQFPYLSCGRWTETSSHADPTPARCLCFPHFAPSLSARRKRIAQAHGKREDGVRWGGGMLAVRSR